MPIDPFIGEVYLFAGTFAPYGFAFCDGQTLPISQNSALFSLLGTTYGGNGTTTFALPDLRGRVPVGAGQGPSLTNRMLGDKFGSETVQLPVTNAVNQVQDSGTPPTTTTTTQAVVAPTDSAAESQAIPNSQPSLALNYIIAINGVYPRRW